MGHMTMPEPVNDLFINSIGKVELLEGDVLRIYLCVERPQENGPSVDEAVISIVVPRIAINAAIQKLVNVAGIWDVEEVRKILAVH